MFRDESSLGEFTFRNITSVMYEGMTKTPTTKAAGIVFFSFNTLFLGKKEHSKNIELSIKAWKVILKEI